MDWTGGYITDVPYLSGCFTAQSPDHLDLACVLNGFEPPARSAGFDWFELGCGHGLTATLLAAAQPQGRFHAADFMPAHIAAARRLAADAALPNVHFHERSFEQLADGAVDLPPLDYVTMHGVYSWVSPENQRHLLRFIDRYLKPGGVVHVSYNAMPGWAKAQPLQRLLLECAGLGAGASRDRLRAGRDVVEALTAAGARWTGDDEGLRGKLDKLRTEEPEYLAHEYLNRCWQPLYHVDVARAFAAAKLDFVGSAQLSRALWSRTMSPAQIAVVDGVADPMLRETIKDYIGDASFRSDVFVRGARSLAPARQRSLLHRSRLGLTVAPARASLRRIGAGGDCGENAIAAAVIGQLDRGPCAVEELAAQQPALMADDMAMLIAVLLVSGEDAVACSAAASDPAAARRLNRLLLATSGDDGVLGMASPATGQPLRIGGFDRMLLRLLDEAAPGTDADATAAVAASIDALRSGPTPPGAPWEGERDALMRRVAITLDERLGLWRQLGLL